MTQASDTAPRDDGDPFDLARFVSAQQTTYDIALGELQCGKKDSHWMWFIFPQLRSLGYSETARRYGITSLDEARAYLAHPTLGRRLRTVCETTLAIDGRSASQIFGDPDDLKLRSCATLFAQVAEAESVFHRVIEQYFGGEFDARTLELLAD